VAVSSVFISGASSGIGRALALQYANNGVHLGLLARREELLERVAQECRGKGASVIVYECDVRDRERVYDSARDFIGKCGGIDLVIANAGIRLEEDNDFMDINVHMETFMTNYIGVYNTVSPFIEAMREKHSGHIVFISSIAAIKATPNSGAYSASKAAVNKWAESVRLRLYSYGIDVTTLCVGFVETEMTKGLPFWMPGKLSSTQAAAMICRAIERKRRVISFPWQSRIIWRTFQIMPDFIYDRIIVWLRSRHSD